ncbi:hypothetical protein BKA69DRAFT_1085399 [Paraphysoderma sedebokerense]|nr:hypothetical protein BKA69DRAFT_1085399 [Paraphysoderma sedebokerense]
MKVAHMQLVIIGLILGAVVNAVEMDFAGEGMNFRGEETWEIKLADSNDSKCTFVDANSTDLIPNEAADGENNHNLRKRGLWSCLFNGRTDTKSVGQADYTLVGYHGTCSKYQSSLEKRLKIPWSVGSNGRLLGGNRFYTTDDLSSAQLYAAHTCSGAVHFGNLYPITCSIFIDTSKLPELRKSYIPQYARYSMSGEDALLWTSEREMQKWESWLFSPSNPEFQNSEIEKSGEIVRFARMAKGVQRRLFFPTFQAAWPKNVLKHMIATCKPSKEVTSSEVKISYRELLSNSSNPDAEVPPVWGRVRGTKYFNPGLHEAPAVIRV